MVAGMILLEKNRPGAHHFLRNKKSRGDLDQSYSTRLAFGEVILKDCQDKNLQVERPDIMDRDDHDPRGLIKPNSISFEGRSAEWVVNTWSEYIVPKYKKVLQKWYKQTGGGGRRLEDFIKYCTIGQTGTTLVWLPWIYAMDAKAGFMLASTAGKYFNKSMVQSIAHSYD